VLLELGDGARVLDVGCGKAGFLRRLLRQTPTARGTGIDTNPAFLSEAASAAAREGLDDRLRLVELPAANFRLDARDFDVVLCFGASQAVGGFDALAKVARKILPSGGSILVGDGFWRRPPSTDYLAVLGAGPEELTDHAENAAKLRAAGFAITATAAASDDEWDEYEGFYCRAKMRWARTTLTTQTLSRSRRQHNGGTMLT
jgi:cyclopropane fatty-acyl-phospholipid synthase-like methyltransferase